MKKLNTKEIQNRLADLNEQRQRIENIKTYLLCVVLGFSVLSCYIGKPMFCALVFIVMPAYVTVHIFLNTKIELILWKLMYVSEHGYRIDPENFSRANALRFVFQIPSRFQKGQVQRILKRLSRRISE